MCCNVLSWVLIILVLNSGKSFASDEEKQKRVDILNVLLNSSGWKRISHVEAKHKNVLISGKDISNDCDLNVEYSKNIKVNVENLNTKYNMTLRLLACVYADQMIKVISALRNILKICSKVRRKARDKAYDKLTLRTIRKHRKPSSSKKKDPVNECENGINKKTNKNIRLNIKVKKLESLNDSEKKYLQTYKESIDCQKAGEMLNFSLDTLKSTWLMFKYIDSAMSYLLDLMPSNESTDKLLQIKVKKKIVYCAVRFETETNDIIRRLLPDINYHPNINAISGNLLRRFNKYLNYVLKPFVMDNCVLSIPDFPSMDEFINVFKIIFPGKQKSDIIYMFGTEIEKCKKDVIENYFSDLGFSYDEEKHRAYVGNL